MGKVSRQISFPTVGLFHDPAVGGRDELLLRLAIENMAQGLFMLDPEQTIIVLNQQFLTIYGLPADIIKVGSTARDIVEQSVLVGNYPGFTLETAWERACARLLSLQPWRVQRRLGNGRVVAITYAPIAGGGWVTTHLDVTERQHAEDRLAFLAGHDALTGLANRARVINTLEQLLPGSNQFAVIFIDLDRFKPVNDEFGHAIGDELLRQVANRLRGCVRDSDLVARLGGDEFTILQMQVNVAEDVSLLASRVVEAIAAPFKIRQHWVQIGASVGIAMAPRDGITADSLLHHADIALYRAKNQGRGRFSLFQP